MCRTRATSFAQPRGPYGLRLSGFGSHHIGTCFYHFSGSSDVHPSPLKHPFGTSTVHFSSQLPLHASGGWSSVICRLLLFTYVFCASSAPFPVHALASMIQACGPPWVPCSTCAPPTTGSLLAGTSPLIIEDVTRGDGYTVDSDRGRRRPAGKATGPSKEAVAVSQAWTGVVG